MFYRRRATCLSVTVSPSLVQGDQDYPRARLSSGVARTQCLPPYVTTDADPLHRDNVA